MKNIIKCWAEDINSVIDKLNEKNSERLLKNKLNHDQIDVFSHSRAAAGEALLTNNEIRTGYNLDGFQWGQVAGTIFRKPFLFISSD